MRMSVGKPLAASALCLTLAACSGPATGRESAPAAGTPSASAAMGEGAASAVPSPAACDLIWGSGEKTAGPLSTAPLLIVDTDRDECWDRVVFEFKGTVQGYSVRYSDRVLTDGEGRDLVPYTAGGAYLWVTLRAPAFDRTQIAASDVDIGDHVVDVDVPYETLRDVVFGGSFEGCSTFAVGVRARLPFRVMSLDGPSTQSRIVVDVAHRW